MKILCNSQGTQSRDPAVTKYQGKYYWIYASESKLYIISADKVDDFVSYSFKPQLKTLGPKYGKQLNQIRELFVFVRENNYPLFKDFYECTAEKLGGKL